MSNEYVIASAQFLKESWYRENAGTPEAQQAKLLDQVFEEIVDYCLNCGIEIDESVEIANEIIEEGLVEEFYEEFLNEAPNQNLINRIYSNSPSITNRWNWLQSNSSNKINNIPSKTGNENIINKIYSNSPNIKDRYNWLNSKPTSPKPDSGNKPPKPTVPTAGSSGGRGGNLGMGGNRPQTPQAPQAPQAPRRVASTLGSASTASASTTPIVPTAPAVPSTTPTMAKLGQGEKDSIFNREGGRQEYEKRMRQAIRTGTQYKPASTGAPVSSSTSNVA